MDTARIKKIGTREEVFKGLAIRTAGGLSKTDIIEKQFGTRILYISKKLSDKMRTNFNIIRENNPNYFKRVPKRTLVAPKPDDNIQLQSPQSQTQPQQQSQSNIQSNMQSNMQSRQIILEQKRKMHNKTHKLSFRVKENTVKNVFYPELQGMNIQQLKEELAREEAIEDQGLQDTGNRNQGLHSGQPKKEFSIEDMPDIDINALE